MSSRKKEALTKSSTLWMLFGLCVITLIVTRFIANTWGIQLLDELYIPGEVSATLQVMSQNQKAAHVWITGTLDIIYPVVFGALLGGVALRFFSNYGRALAIPALLGVLMDFSENAIQILALTGNEDVLFLKSYVTPTKMVLFLTAFLIAITAWARWLLSLFCPSPSEA